MGGGVFLNKNILSKTKQGLVVGILLCSGIGNVRAVTTNEVTYNNNGVEENLTETLDTLYTELKQYKTGGNVTPSEMLEGSNGYSKGVLVIGSIKKKEATTYTPGVNNITINKGQYLNGNQVILGDSNLKPENIKSGVSIFGINGTYTSDATATSSKILEGETCYVNGEKIEGSLSNKSGLTVEASEITSDSEFTYLTIPESGYYDTSSKVKVEEKNLNFNILDINNLPFWITTGSLAEIPLLNNYKKLNVTQSGTHDSNNKITIYFYNKEDQQIFKNNYTISKNQTLSFEASTIFKVRLYGIEVSGFESVMVSASKE